MTTSPRPPRVVLLINSLGIGGAQTQLVHLAAGLVEAGWDVAVHTLLPPPDPSPTLAQVRALGVPVHVLGDGARGGPAAMLVRARRTLAAHAPDVLVTFLFHANVVGRVAGRTAGVPVVVSSIRNERFGGRLRELAIRATAPLATLTTVNSRQAAASLSARGIVRPERLHVVPNAVTAPVLRTAATHGAARTALGLDDEFLLLSIGRLTPQKDHRTLLRAFALAADGHPGLRLWIAGEGPERTGLEQLAGELGIAGRVSFLGFRTDVGELLLVADALVHSSLWEGSPNVVLEAMAAGLPVIATDAAGVAELLDGDDVGLRVPPADAAALAGAIDQLLELPSEERWRQVRRARTVARDRHGPAVVAARWLQVIDLARSIEGAAPAATGPADVRS